LSKNKIENVDERFKAFTKLEDLRLSENTLYNFKGLPFLTSVKHLDLAHTPIRILPFEIKEMESLEYLDASRCLIKSIKALKGAQQLTYLDLNKNKLEEFPEDLDLWALEYLDVDANKIQTVHGVVKSCPNLSTLHASFETTASLNEIGELKHLEDLELTCDINGPVPLGVGKLEKLRALKMTSCNLFDISVLAKNTALKTLDVSDNNIIQIPEQMSNLKDLEVLNVSNNHDISSYVGLKGMQSLKTVDLSNNSLEYIPEELYYLKNIETVILEGNDISAEEIKLFQERFPEKELRL
ncbi:MAG: hypothetical protein MRY83_12585, partial [Flavobacteriales bacterium]|nr:hypothetical protein [Flavobacteriales bacterium]